MLTWGFKWLIQTTDYHPEGSVIGIRINFEDIHIIEAQRVFRMFETTAPTAEYDEMSDVELSEEEEDGDRYEE